MASLSNTSCRQARRQVGRQAGKEVGKQAGKQAVKQASEKSRRGSAKLAGEHSVKTAAIAARQTGHAYAQEARRPGNSNSQRGFTRPGPQDYE